MAEYIFSGVKQRDTTVTGIFFKCYWEILDEEIFINNYGKECVRTHFRINKFTVGSTSSTRQQFNLKDNYFYLYKDLAGSIEFPEGQDRVLYNVSSIDIDASQGEVTLVENKEFYTVDVLQYKPEEETGSGYSTDFSIKFSTCSIYSSSGSFLNTFKGKNMDIEPSRFVVHPEVIGATDFNDEEDPTITYPAVIPTGVTLQACISFTGGEDDVPYRDIPLVGGSYTFNLTEEERKALRQAITAGDTKAVRFYIKSTYKDTTQWKYLTKNLTLINHVPILNPTVKDIKPETLALTGDENTFIRYASMAEYSSGAEARKEATLVSQSVTCGSKTVEGLPNGVIDDVESGTFTFNVTDSRGFGASSSVFKNIIDYVKPTCYQKLEILLSGETSANIHLTVNGNYFNGSFGAIENTFKLEVRYTDDNGNIGAWQTLSGTPTFNGNTYKLEATFSGFTYEKAYTFQCRLTDKLNVVESAQYTTRVLPVFDWSETDFNFNVPVNIEADDLSMHGETIIRHSDSTNNTILSATGGHIYLRPGGTDDTSGQTILYNNGNIDISGNTNFGGTVNFSSSFTIGGYILNDYVIETGSEAMGSNGTWYWQKWLSGKAECWGCRNFGSMATTTTWGSLYRSAVFTQDLPDGVFVRTPDAININFVHATGAAWICKHENTAPSAVTTGSFVVVRPTSGNISSPTNIGFHIIGEWY